jgi:hypothetical protein
MRALLAFVLLVSACADDSLLPNSQRLKPKVVDPSVANPDVAKPTEVKPQVEQPEIKGPDHWTDVFRQRDAKVDVLWVIDVSDSMEDERTQLAANFDSFMNSLTASGADYRIGVTTTDLSADGDGGTLVGPTPVITSATPNPKAAFTQNITLQPRLATEQPLESACRVLTTAAGGALIRKEAALAVIILTDEDDSSIGSAGYYQRTFRSAKGPGNQNAVTVSALAGNVPDGCVIPGYEDVLGAGAAAAKKIVSVIDATNGAFGSICDRDFSPTLDKIGWKVAGLTKIFPLSKPPVLGTIVVLVNGNTIPEDATAGWQFREQINSITFAGTYVPEANAEIKVSYGVVQ